MAEGVDAASFDFYEGIRIFIPGAVAVGLAEGVNRTFGITRATVSHDTIVALVAALLTGLIFYYVDAPAKAAIYSPLQPTDVLAAWGVKPKNGGIVNTYFVILDDTIPAHIRARSLYMGSMFRIGYESIYLFLVTSITIMTSPLWTSRHPHFRVAHVKATVPLVSALTVSLWMFAVQRHRVEVKRTRPTDVNAVNRSRADYCLLAFSLLLCLALLWQRRSIPAWFLALPTAITGLTWSVRYFRGYPPSGDSKKRRPVAAPHALLLAGVTVLYALMAGTMHTGGAPHVAPPARNGWAMCAALGITLICARGHEKRLRGAYMTQNTWLNLNKDRLLRQYFQDDVLPGSPRATNEGYM